MLFLELVVLWIVEEMVCVEGWIVGWFFGILIMVGLGCWGMDWLDLFFGKFFGMLKNFFLSDLFLVIVGGVGWMIVICGIFCFGVELIEVCWIVVGMFCGLVELFDSLNWVWSGCWGVKLWLEILVGLCFDWVVVRELLLFVLLMYLLFLMLVIIGGRGFLSFEVFVVCVWFLLYFWEKILFSVWLLLEFSDGLGRSFVVEGFVEVCVVFVFGWISGCFVFFFGCVFWGFFFWMFLKFGNVGWGFMILLLFKDGMFFLIRLKYCWWLVFGGLVESGDVVWLFGEVFIIFLVLLKLICMDFLCLIGGLWLLFIDVLDDEGDVFFEGFECLRVDLCGEIDWGGGECLIVKFFWIGLKCVCWIGLLEWLCLCVIWVCFVLIGEWLFCMGFGLVGFDILIEGILSLVFGYVFCFVGIVFNICVKGDFFGFGVEFVFCCVGIEFRVCVKEFVGMWFGFGFLGFVFFLMIEGCFLIFC